MISIRHRFITQLFTSLLIFISSSSFATVILPLSLDQLSQKAAVIFQGRVTAVEVKLDEVSQRVATFTTFAVSDSIKGNVGNEHTVKQFGGKLPGSDMAVRIHGIPEFRIGEEHIVFLPQPSRLGFASPIGLSQGMFSISDDGKRRIISNGRSIEQLSTQTDVTSLRPGQGSQTTTQFRSDASLIARTQLKAVAGKPRHSSLEDFKSTVRDMVAR